MRRRCCYWCWSLGLGHAGGVICSWRRPHEGSWAGTWRVGQRAQRAVMETARGTQRDAEGQQRRLERAGDEVGRGSVLKKQTGRGLHRQLEGIRVSDKDLSDAAVAVADWLSLYSSLMGGWRQQPAWRGIMSIFKSRREITVKSYKKRRQNMTFS